MKYSPIVVVAGPTAIGKTDLAIKLAKEFDGYIINGDSRQVYKELLIGTARPTDDDIKKSKIPHYLFGHKSITDDYNIYEYQKEVKDILERNNNKIAFLVGGSGLYVDSVVYNYNLQENKKDRKKLKGLTVSELQDIIGNKISELNESDKHNPRRLIRFIEKDGNEFTKGERLNHIYLVYYKEFEEVEKNIRKRIDKMFEQGLLEENEKLRGFEVIETIGYREFDDYFLGKIDIKEIKERIYINTRKYAKRQISWFKRNNNAILIKDYKTARSECKNFLSSI